MSVKRRLMNAESRESEKYMEDILDAFVSPFLYTFSSLPVLFLLHSNFVCYFLLRVKVKS